MPWIAGGSIIVGASFQQTLTITAAVPPAYRIFSASNRISEVLLDVAISLPGAGRYFHGSVIRPEQSTFYLIPVPPELRSVGATSFRFGAVLARESPAVPPLTFEYWRP